MLTLANTRGRRDPAITFVLVLAATALAALLAARAPLGVDYTGPPHTLCDCAAAPIRALAGGHLHEFFSTQPVMGSASLLLRAPFAALGLHLGDGSELTLYRLGAFPCLLAAGLLGAYLFERMRDLERPLLACVLVAGLVALNPLTGRALKYGHPEEILAAALAIAAVLAAGRRRPLLAGVLLGAAFATKQWALLATLPALAVADGRRVRLALAAAGTAALLLVPMAAGDLHRFVTGNHGAGVVGPGVMPTNVWFPLGHDVPVLMTANGWSSPPRALPAALAAASHPLILAAGFGLAIVWWHRGRHGSPDDALLLLALVCLVRCLLDPMTNSYYHLPFLMSLAAWEGLRRERAPLLTAAATVLIALTMSVAGAGVTGTDLNRLYLLWALPFAVGLGLLAFRPGRRIIGLEARSREEGLRWAD